MRESWQRRLEALEEARKLQDGPLEITCINFIRADGRPVEVAFAPTRTNRLRPFRIVRVMNARPPSREGRPSWFFTNGKGLSMQRSPNIIYVSPLPQPSAQASVA
jgi:hypothetical protein